jgi:hypothetical protein
MSLLQDILNDLRERRLWPVALVLLAALVAVPVLLSSSPGKSSPPVTASPLASAAANPATALPAVTVSNQQTHSRLKGRRHDPFAQPKAPKPTSATSTTATTTGSSTTATSKSTTTTSSTTTGSTPAAGGGGTSAGSGSGTPAVPIVPAKPAKPAPTGLKDNQSYDVTFAMTTVNGGLNTTDALERLSVIPGPSLPLLVELGVLKGAHRVLFAVEQGAVLSGPGQCTPGPVDCEILSLATDQVESLGLATPTGTFHVAQFAVTAISAHNYRSVAAANKARRQSSADGRTALNRSNSSALSLFPYKPSLGAIVDLRNLSVGGK